MSSNLKDPSEKPLESTAPEQLGLDGFADDSLHSSPESRSAQTLDSQTEFKPQTLGKGTPKQNFSSTRKTPQKTSSQSQAADGKRILPPMLQQYLQIKKQYPQHLLLLQVGDFYEVFFDDAKLVSEELGIRLTSRDKDASDPVPMCGVPIHALDNYLPRLLQGGYSCVVMSQVEESKNKKGGVRREISRIVTPGVRYEGDGLDEKHFNYLAAVVLGAGGVGAVSFVDVSTGHLRIQETESVEELFEVVRRIEPSEMLLPATLFSVAPSRAQGWVRDVKRIAQDYGCRVVFRSFERISRDSIHSRIQTLLYGEERPDGSCSHGVEQMSPIGLSCLDAVLSYVEEVSFGAPPRLSKFSVDEPSSVVFVDAATRRNLELFKTRIDGERRNSLFGHIDQTRTAMGSRLLADWIMSPSSKREEILARHETVEELRGSCEILGELRELLTGVRDIDRLVSRITGGRANPRDLGTLRDSIESLPRILEILKDRKSPIMNELGQQFDALEDISACLGDALVQEPPLRLNEGGIFQDGYHEEVDRTRVIRRDGHQWLSQLEKKEKERSGISGLRIKYNNVFGYFIEVSKAHLAKVPENYERKQTLVNAERFVTKELKDFEVEILSAKAKQYDLERQLFSELRSNLCAEVTRIQSTSYVLSVIDVLCSFAEVASVFNYTRPVMREDLELRISGGRHPVVERVLGAHNFVPNDALLNAEDRRFAILTGPNMGGKSTYLRQVGLIQLMAQAGSFVPAEMAQLGIVDRIFTRIGAADDLTRGDSTFMVEMREAAVIVKKASPRSLVLIDEIGRGTATTDGLALATAISEWLLDHIGCRTIFATHFHELTRISELGEGAFSLAVGVVENDKDILFTHRIEEKTADRSYGIEVARLAGLPEALLRRAEAVLVTLESPSGDLSKQVAIEHVDAEHGVNAKKLGKEELVKDSMFRQIRDKLQNCNPEAITPLQALHELVELKELIDPDL